MYGMNWIEPAAGHVLKGASGDPTDLVLERGVQVRQTSAKCDPQFKVPHYQAVGLEDVYAGDNGGAYRSKRLWTDYSTNVLGCSGDPYVLGSSVHPSSECSQYPSCSFSADSNVYCAVRDMGHEPQYQATFLATAYADFFEPGFSYECDSVVEAPANGAKVFDKSSGGCDAQATEAACVAQGLGGSPLAHGEGQDCVVLLPGQEANK